MWLARRRRRSDALGTLTDKVERLSKRVERQDAVLKARGADSGPPPPDELVQAAAGHGDRAVLLDIGGQEVVAVLAGGTGDPGDLYAAICHEVTERTSSRDVAS